jgi:TRAP-type mannitol/chloroaromatic compound transport system substrate-binding protein
MQKLVGAATALAVVALAGGVPATAEADEFRLTFQSTWPSADPHQTNFVRWAEQVAKNTGGRVQIETLPAGSVVPAFEVLDAIHDQVIDGGHSWTGYWVGKNRASVMVSSGPAGPFGMDSFDYWGWIWIGGGLEAANEFFQNDLDANVFWMPAGSSGPQSLGWFNVELQSMADMQGLRYRIPGIPGEMYGEMGVSVITLPGGEIVPAGERGVIDAGEYVNPYHDEALGFHDVWQYHFAPAYHETVTVMDVVFNKDVWDSIPEDLQNIITVTTQAHYMWWENHKPYNNRSPCSGWPTRVWSSGARPTTSSRRRSTPGTASWPRSTPTTRPSSGSPTRSSNGRRTTWWRGASSSRTGRPSPTSTGRRAGWSSRARSSTSSTRRPPTTTCSGGVAPDRRGRAGGSRAAAVPPAGAGVPSQRPSRPRRVTRHVA